MQLPRGKNSISPSCLGDEKKCKTKISADQFGGKKLPTDELNGFLKVSLSCGDVKSVLSRARASIFGDKT